MNDEGYNRAALLTAPGAAAIAVVRLTGRGVGEFLSKHFSKPVKPNRCVHGNLIDDQGVIDDPVVVLYDTGADINLHGGEWVVRECLNLAERSGFHIADPLDLIDASTMIEREMLESLPYARTERTIRALLSQPRQWTRFLQEIPSIDKPEVQFRVRQLLTNDSLRWLLIPPKIAVVGIPNVGKSTLANQLFGRQRSITADLPGTTRDWVGDWADINGLPVHLLDTPGQRDSSDPIEQSAITRSSDEIETSDLILLVLDPTRPLEGDQSELRRRYPDAMIVINKSDRPTMWDTSLIHAIHTIATTGDGIDTLRASIFNRFVQGDPSIHPRWWTQRHREILIRAQGDASVLPQIINQ